MNPVDLYLAWLTWGEAGLEWQMELTKEWVKEELKHD